MSRLTMRKHHVLTALVTAAALAAAGLVSAVPAAASTSQVLADCNANGHLTGKYSRHDLQGALNGMGADTREYTNCYDVVRRALLASAASGGGNSGGGHAGGGPSSGSGQTPGQAGAPSANHNPGVSTRGVYSSAPNASAAGHGKSRAVSLDGSKIRPGATGVNTSSGVRSLPAPLIGVLVLLGLAALSGGGIALRRRVVTRHGG